MLLVTSPAILCQSTTHDLRRVGFPRYGGERVCCIVANYSLDNCYPSRGGNRNITQHMKIKTTVVQTRKLIRMIGTDGWCCSIPTHEDIQDYIGRR